MDTSSRSQQPALFENLEPRLLLSGSDIIPDAPGDFTSEWFSVVAEQTATSPLLDYSASAQAIHVEGTEYVPGYYPGQWIVQFTEQAASQMNGVADAAEYLDESINFSVLKGLGRRGLVLIETPGTPEEVAFDWLAADPDVAYFQLNYVASPNATHPNDEFYPFDGLWGLNNEGILYGPETEDNDIDAPEAWDITTGSEDVVVAVIDSGVDWRHPEFHEFDADNDHLLIDTNMWHNPGELAVGMGIPGVLSDSVFPFKDDASLDDWYLADADEDTYDPDIFGGSTDRIDNEGNGFIDDMFGYDFGSGDWDPSPDTQDGGHGTHVAGTIGAIGNNVEGVVGVNWDVSIMALKVADDEGGLADSAIISAINYCTYMKTQHGVNVVASNNSWGRTIIPSQAYEDAIEGNRAAGILFVVAAGNEGTNNDAVPAYPTNYSLDFDNVISVAATDPWDMKCSFSNYGEESVHIGAPGEFITSTWPGEYYLIGDEIPSIYDPGDAILGFEPTYNTLQGTSMAAPHVTGAAALLASVVPSASYLDLKNAILTSVDRIEDLQGATTTGGRLNVYKALLALTGSTVEGTVYEDGNIADGIPYAPGVDTPLASVKVFLDFPTETAAHGNGFRDPWEPLTTTNLSGEYLFTDLSAGTYYARLLAPVDAAIDREENAHTGWTLTEPFITDGVLYQEVTVGDVTSELNIDFGLVDSRPDVLDVTGTTTQGVPYETDLFSTDVHPVPNQTADADMLYFLLDEAGNPVTSLTTDAGTFDLNQNTVFGAIPADWHVGDTLVGSAWEGEIQSIDTQLTFGGGLPSGGVPGRVTLSFNEIPYVVLNKDATLALDNVPGTWLPGHVIGDANGDWDGEILSINGNDVSIDLAEGARGADPYVDLRLDGLPEAIQNRGYMRDITVTQNHVTLTFGTVPGTWQIGDLLDDGEDWDGVIVSMSGNDVVVDLDAGPGGADTYEELDDDGLPEPVQNVTRADFQNLTATQSRALLTFNDPTSFIPAFWQIGDIIGDGEDWDAEILTINGNNVYVDLNAGPGAADPYNDLFLDGLPEAVENLNLGDVGRLGSGNLLVTEGRWEDNDLLAGTFWSGTIVPGSIDNTLNQLQVDLVTGTYNDIVPETINNAARHNTGVLTTAGGSWQTGDTLVGSGWQGTIQNIAGNVVDVSLFEGSFGDITDAGLPETIDNIQRNNTADVTAALNQNTLVFDLTVGTYDDVIAESITNIDQGTNANLTAASSNHLTYTPAPGFFGDAIVDYIARDAGNEMFLGQQVLLWFQSVPLNWQIGDVIDDDGDWDAQILAMGGRWVSVDLALGATVDTFAEITLEEIFNPARNSSADLIEATPVAMPENYGDAVPATITIDVDALPVVGDVTTVVRQTGNTLVYFPIVDADAALVPGDAQFNFVDDPLVADADGTLAFDHIDSSGEGIWFTYTGPGAGTFDEFTYTYRDADGYLSNVGTVNLGLADVTPFIPGSPAVLNLPGGDMATIYLVGPGNGIIYAPPAGWPGGPDSNIDAAAIELFGTTAATTLYIRTYGSDFRVGDIIVDDNLADPDDGQLYQIYGPTTDILGDITVPGPVLRITLDDINSPLQQTLVIGPGGSVNMVCDRIRNLDITSASPFTGLRTTEWIDNEADVNPDTFTTPSIYTLYVTGDAWRGLDGMFAPDLVVDNSDGAFYSLANAVINGGLARTNADGTDAAMTWDIAGRVGTINMWNIPAQNELNNWTLGNALVPNEVQRLYLGWVGDITVNGLDTVYGSILAKRWEDGILNADTINSLRINGGYVNRYMFLEGDFGPTVTLDPGVAGPGDGGFGLWNGYVQGAVTGPWDVQGDLYSLSAGGIETEDMAVPGAESIYINGDAWYLRVYNEALVLNDPDAATSNPDTYRTGKIEVEGESKVIYWLRGGIKGLNDRPAPYEFYTSSNGGNYSLEELLYQINRDNPAGGGDWDYQVTGRNTNGTVDTPSNIDWSDIPIGEAQLKGRAYYYYNVTETPTGDLDPETVSLFFDNDGNTRLHNWNFIYNNGENYIDLELLDNPIIAPREMTMGQVYTSQSNYEGLWGSGVDSSGEINGFYTSGDATFYTRLLGTEQVTLSDGTTHVAVKGMSISSYVGTVEFNNGSRWTVLGFKAYKRQTWWADPNTGVVKSETYIVVTIGRRQYYQLVTNERT